MRWPFRYSSKHIRLLAVLTGSWVVITTLSTLLFFVGPSELPLWSSLVVPADQLARREFIFVFPLISGAILVSGFWFGRKSEMEHEEYLSALSLVGSIVLQSLLLLALLRIGKVVL